MQSQVCSFTKDDDGWNASELALPSLRETKLESVCSKIYNQVESERNQFLSDEYHDVRNLIGKYSKGFDPSLQYQEYILSVCFNDWKFNS